MINNTFKHQNPVDANLSPLGDSQNSKWWNRGITPFYESTVTGLYWSKVCIFVSERVIKCNICTILKLGWTLMGLTSYKIKMASKMAAKTIKFGFVAHI